MKKVIAEDFSIDKVNKKDFKQSVIKRSNLTNEFTLVDIEAHQAELAKAERELKAQIRVSTAVVENVKRNHAFVSKLSDEALSVAQYLFEAKDTLNKAEKKLKDVVKSKKNYKEVVDTIYKKFGFIESNILENEPNK